MSIANIRIIIFIASGCNELGQWHLCGQPKCETSIDMIAFNT